MPDYQHEPMIRFLDLLLDRSRDQLVPWQVVGEHSFGVQTAEARVVITSREGNDRAPFDLELYQPDGLLLDSLASAEVDGRQAPWNQSLQNLYFKAREIARDVPGVIQGFFEAISFGHTVPIEGSDASSLETP